jgi:hypothetical protein
LRSIQKATTAATRARPASAATTVLFFCTGDVPPSKRPAPEIQAC